MGLSKTAYFFSTQFSWSKFGLKSASALNFYDCQWSVVPRVVYVGYRILLAVYFLVWMGISIDQGGGIIEGTTDEEAHHGESKSDRDDESASDGSDWNNYPKWWYCVYLTNWTYSIFNFYLIVAATNVALEYIKSRRSPRTDISEESGPLPVLSRVHWLVYNIQAGMNVVVIIGFWTALVPFSPEARDNLNSISYNVHLVNGLVTLGDLFMVAIPINLAHAVFPAVFAISYLTFSVIYWAAGGLPFPIYPMLNYEDYPAITAGFIVGFGLVAIPLIWLAIFALTQLRMWLWEKYDTRSTVASENVLSTNSPKSYNLAVISNNDLNGRIV